MQIDIQIELDDLEVHEMEEIRDVVFAMDDWIERETTIKGSDSDSSTEHADSDCASSDYEDAELVASNYKLMFAKLDALMTLMIQFIKGLPRTPQGFQQESELESVFFSLIEIFERLILPTHRIKSSQFIIFYITSLDDSFADQFMGVLVSHLLSETPSPIIRTSATSYLGSFIARARYVPILSVRKCLSILNQFTQSFVEKQENRLQGRLDPERYPALYAAVQAILYIFCFHWKNIMIHNDVPITGSFPPELLGFQRVLMSKFNPLTVWIKIMIGLFRIDC